MYIKLKCKSVDKSRIDWGRITLKSIIAKPKQQLNALEMRLEKYFCSKYLCPSKWISTEPSVDII